MRIAYYSAGLSQSGGSGAHAHGLADAWARSGHVVLRLPDAASAGPVEATRLRKPRLSTGLGIQLARDARARLRALANVGGLTKRMSAFSAELLIARRGRYDYTLDALLASTRQPWVAEVNGLSWIEQRDLLGAPPLSWEIAREERFVREADAAVAITDESRQQLLACGVQPEKIAVVHNGADVQAFRPGLEVDRHVAEWARSFSPVVAFCGTGAYTFDHATLCTAMTTLATLLPTAGFLFVGPSPADVATWCPASLRLADRLLCTSRVPHAQVPSLIAAADLFWSAYRNDYGSPLKQFEYMAMGRPVVVAGDGQAAWLVDAAECGRAVHRQDASGLAASVADLWALEGSLRRELGENGRTWTVTNASWDAVAQRLLDACGSLRTARS